MSTAPLSRLWTLPSGEVKVVAHVPGRVSDIVWTGPALYFLANNVPKEATSGLAVYKILLPGGVNDVGSLYEKVNIGQDCCPASLQQVGGGVLMEIQKGLEQELRPLGESNPLLSEKKSSNSFMEDEHRTGALLLPAHWEM
ncbi:acylamino-acid-releasing enzyme [Apiospora aurea]|uniref:Acylamino-acid-releasing enzyme n=1 Tax=Apiospora aurea TaxID=335848 RepID=A0ABR1Q137_9PEZI